MNDRNRVRTPCVGTCSTVFGDVVCRGCRRFLHEIRDWNGYEDAQKAAVWARLREIAERVLGSRLLILDAVLLRQRAAEAGVRITDEDSNALIALGVLRQLARHTRRLETLGLASVDANIAPTELLAGIERDLQAVSEAHYERYFQPRIEF